MLKRFLVALAIIVATAAPAVALTGGGSGNDIILGTVSDDFLSGGAGDDFVRGNDGDDVIHAGPGADHIKGGRGRDTAFVDAKDTVTGVELIVYV